MKEYTPSRSAAQQAILHSEFSDRPQRERLLWFVLLLAHQKADAIAAAVQAFEPVGAFRFLRRLSGLTIRIPEDEAVLSEFFSPERVRAFSVGMDSREIEFPRFEEIAEIVEQVRCYSLYEKYRSKKLVAEMLRKPEAEVYRAYKAVASRLKGLRGVV